MSLNFRKSIKAGPFRINLSKSGIGVSAGVKGLRVGKGPRGSYLHAGRGGVYYRKNLSSGSKENLQKKSSIKKQKAQQNSADRKPAKARLWLFIIIAILAIILLAN